ncbi:MAG: hypothetical protein ACLQG3_14245 [Terracidiphilus sp.]
MKNITVSVPDETYRQARIWAAERGTSVSKAVAYLLQILPSHPRINKQFFTPTQPESTSNSAPQAGS